MTLSRILTVANMQARDLARRRLVMGILVALPLPFYLSRAGEEQRAFAAGAIGVGWCVGGAGMFLALASRRADARLVLSGYRPTELLAGRLLFLGGVALILVAFYSVLMIGLSDPREPTALVAGIALMGSIAVPLGLALAALVPRELEAALMLIAIMGVEMGLPTGSAMAPALPLYGPLKLMQVAAGFETGMGAAVLHSLASAAVLLALAMTIFARRTRVRKYAI